MLEQKAEKFKIITEEVERLGQELHESRQQRVHILRRQLDRRLNNEGAASEIPGH